MSDFRSWGPGFRTTYCCFETWATSFTLHSLCLSEEAVKAVGPFYLVSMPGEVKDLTQGNGKTCCGLTEPVISFSKYPDSWTLPINEVDPVAVGSNSNR